MVQITRRFWYLKARKNYVCAICGKTISKGEYYYRYKTYTSQRDPYFGPRTYTNINLIYCKECGKREYEREKEMEKRMLLKWIPLCAGLSIGIAIGFLFWVFWSYFCR